MKDKTPYEEALETLAELCDFCVDNNLPFIFALSDDVFTRSRVRAVGDGVAGLERRCLLLRQLTIGMDGEIEFYAKEVDA